jgi:hypothetical protein
MRFNIILRGLPMGTVMLGVLVTPPAVADRPMPAHKVLEPIRQGNLTIFPVVAATNANHLLVLGHGYRTSV